MNIKELSEKLDILNESSEEFKHPNGRTYVMKSSVNPQFKGQNMHDIFLKTEKASNPLGQIQNDGKKWHVRVYAGEHWHKQFPYPDEDYVSKNHATKLQALMEFGNHHKRG